MIWQDFPQVAYICHCDSCGVSEQRMANLTIHLASFYGHLQLDRVNKPVLLFTQSIIQGVDSADITPVTTVIA